MGRGTRPGFGSLLGAPSSSPGLFFFFLWGRAGVNLRYHPLLEPRTHLRLAWLARVPVSSSTGTASLHHSQLFIWELRSLWQALYQLSHLIPCLLTLFL